MNRFSKLITATLGVVTIMILAACGGLGGNANASLDGLRFPSSNPSQAIVGTTERILVEAFPVGTFEYNSNYTVSAVADNGATVTPGNTTIHFGNGADQSVLVPLDVTLPDSLVPGTPITITASRSAGAGYTIRNTTFRLIASQVMPSVTTSFNPTAVNAAAGGNAVSTLTVVPQAGFTGTLNLVGLIPDVVCIPNTLTFAAGETSKTSTITYRVPASSPVGEAKTVPVRIYNSSVTSTASFQATTIAAASGDFTLDVAPASIMVSGGNVSSPITVTITPTGGFTGDVTVTFSLPGQGSLILAQGRQNPFNVNVSGTNPVQVTVPLSYVPGTGSAPIGTATVTATRGSTTHSATFTVGAS